MKRSRQSFTELMKTDEVDIDDQYRRLIGEDECYMPIPSFDADTHLLTSKVRKHYFESVIKLLSVNYENSQRLPGKNIRLPSAIWRCARYIELQAVQACMLMQLYRQNIMTVIKQLRADTEKGKLHKQLFDCLSRPPINDKSVQVNHDAHLERAKKPKRHFPTDSDMDKIYDSIDKKIESQNQISHKSKDKKETDSEFASIFNDIKLSHSTNGHSENKTETDHFNLNKITENENPQKPIPDIAESNVNEDKLMLEMEKLFQTDEVEDIFEGTLDFSDIDKKENTQKTPEVILETPNVQSLDERIAKLSSIGVLENPVPNRECPKQNKSNVSKWICELYYQKLKLSETMDLMIESNRRKHERVKKKFIELFGEDEEEYALMSPLDETPEFISSCNERIAPFVVKNLMKYYKCGRIKSKDLFKRVAKHIMDRIISCDRFPDEYTVYSFITNYFRARPVIRCQADF